MSCKGCGENKKLIRAHIIPESFFVGLKSDGKGPLMVADELQYPKRAPIGVYDRAILCHDCEQKFQDIDNYGQQILLKSELKSGEVNGAVYYKISNANYELLKLFFISILWRASVSTQPYYSKVQLGKFEWIAKNIVWNRQFENYEEFSFILARFTDNEFGTAMLNPRRLRFSGVNYYIFYLYGFILYVKVDQRQTPLIFKPFIMKENQDLLVVGRDIFKSKELKAMHEIVINR
jgi:hypothetical protein